MDTITKAAHARLRDLTSAIKQIDQQIEAQMEQKDALIAEADELAKALDAAPDDA